MTTATLTHQFEVGDKLAARSISDYDCIFRFEVVARTAKFVTVTDGYDTRRCAVKIDRDGREYLFPLGHFSMAPIVRAKVQVAQ